MLLQHTLKVMKLPGDDNPERFSATVYMFTVDHLVWYKTNKNNRKIYYNTESVPGILVETR